MVNPLSSRGGKAGVSRHALIRATRVFTSYIQMRLVTFWAHGGAFEGVLPAEHATPPPM
jgi:hypothetical protein